MDEDFKAVVKWLNKAEYIGENMVPFAALRRLLADFNAHVVLCRSLGFIMSDEERSEYEGHGEFGDNYGN